MTKVMKKILVVLAVAVCFISVQNVSAETLTGVITGISERPNTVTVDDGTEVYGIRFKYLCNVSDIFCDLVGESVTITADEFECADGTIKLKATSITVGDVTVTLR